MSSQFKTIKWKDRFCEYELQVRNVGDKNDCPIQIMMEEWNGKRRKFFDINIPSNKVKEFLEALKEDK